MDIEEWIDWMRSRPDRKARQRRLFDALDIALPSWENVLVIPGFKIWANWRHPVIGKTRLDILKSLSLGNFDGKNTARLLNIAHQEIGILQQNCTLSVNPTNLFSHGSIIDKLYEVMRSLGIGGFGVVTMVYSHEVEEFFALKMIRSEHLVDVKSRARFIQEANLWINLERHENIVRSEFVDAS